MIFSYKWLQSYFKKPLPKPEKLAELLTMHAFEVEEIKKVGKDYILDIDVLPNRGPDCFSHIGIAREIVAITGLRFKKPEIKLREDKKTKSKDFVGIKVENKNDCSRYTGRVICDVKVGTSPKWIQERLKVCGLRPINNIVDIANYVMLETGQPLHVFDFKKIEGGKKKKIIIQRAEKGEKIITLDDEKYNLDKNVLIIADSKGPLAIAGIKGGKKAEIDKKTKTIVLESANFNSKVVRKSSKALGLKTDASWRFEHKIDPNLTEVAINRAAYLIQEEAKGKIVLGLVDSYPKKVLPKKIKLDLDYVEKLLGIKIPEREIKRILGGLGLKIGKQPSGESLLGPGKLKILNVAVPTFRLDISLPEDLIEEIGRIYGFQRIPTNFPVVSLIPPKRNFEIFWENIIKDIIKESGFTEVYNYSFIGEKEAKIFGYSPKEMIELENPMSLDQKYLRLSLIPNLLKNVRDNFKYFNEIRIFELGKMFGKEQKDKPTEKRMLTGLITQKQGDESGFYRLKGVIDSLLNKLGISNVWYDSYQQTPEESRLKIWHPKKSSEIKVDHQEIGFLGEISSKTLKDLRIREKVVLFDIDFEKLTKLCSEEHQYQPISQFPAAIRDLAILVPINAKVVDVLNKINIAGGSLVRDVDLFDIYEGEGILGGKKNLAFHIIYQAEDRTLKSKEIDKLHQKIIKALEKDPKWEVRR